MMHCGIRLNEKIYCITFLILFTITYPFCRRLRELHHHLTLTLLLNTQHKLFQTVVSSSLLYFFHFKQVLYCCITFIHTTFGRPTLTCPRALYNTTVRSEVGLQTARSKLVWVRYPCFLRIGKTGFSWFPYLVPS